MTGIGSLTLLLQEILFSLYLTCVALHIWRAFSRALGKPRHDIWPSHKLFMTHGLHAQIAQDWVIDIYIYFTSSPEQRLMRKVQTLSNSSSTQVQSWCLHILMWPFRPFICALSSFPPKPVSIESTDNFAAHPLNSSSWILTKLLSMFSLKYMFNTFIFGNTPMCSTLLDFCQKSKWMTHLCCFKILMTGQNTICL